MNRYDYSDIYIGQTEHFTVCITEAMLEKFMTLTGDNNRLHCEREFAIQHGYADRVCYGMLTSSFLSTLAGVYLPGENSLIREVNIKFHKPVYVGDTLDIVGEVVSMQKNFNAFEMKVTIVNDKGERVLRGKMQMSVL